MGWYAFVPFMECFHGVVSTHHSLEGYVELNDKKTDFTGGTGYIEKDWGTLLFQETGDRAGIELSEAGELQG